MEWICVAQNKATGGVYCTQEQTTHHTKAGIFVEDPNECWVISKSVSTVSSKQIRIQSAKQRAR